MTPFTQRILIVGGFGIGVGILALLFVIAYALLRGNDGGSELETAQITATASASPTTTATPLATPSSVPATATPERTPEVTPEPTEQPPPPTPVVQQPVLPPVEEQPPPQEEPPQPTKEPPPPTPEPTPPPPTPTPVPPTPTPPPIVDVFLSQQCYSAWFNADGLALEIHMAPLTGTDTTYLEEDLAQLDAYINANCLSPLVVPVANPAADLPSLCAQARSRSTSLSTLMSLTEISGAPKTYLQQQKTRLDSFIGAHCY